jgi:SAM-dependent methyltransferase
MIRFEDGAAYERSMGLWSRPAGEVFLDWLAPLPGLRWLDVGCGNGAFTELLMQRCSPVEAIGVDPSEGQLAYARTRPGARGADFRQGDAMALPFDANIFDAAAMALAIFFVPDPARGVAEMARVVRPGGIVATYAWDFSNGGFPYGVVQDALRAIGVQPPLPPSVGAERIDSLRALWSGAGLRDVETMRIPVERRFDSMTDFWESLSGAASLRETMAALDPGDLARMKEMVEAQLRIEADGSVRHRASANAIKGRVPG